MKISVIDVSKRFGSFAALDHVNLEVRSGELLALLGPSGSGKTTLLRIIAGLDWPDEGQVQFNGEDALARSAVDSPDLLIDIATLTGAQLVALGPRVAGVMANDDALAAGVAAASDRAGEAAWAMPLPGELRKGLDSSVADLANVSGDRNGGMLVAGLFLREFVPDGVPWAHIDIAGPSFNESDPFGYTPRGGTGAATRALVQIAEDVAAGTLPAE